MKMITGKTLRKDAFELGWGSVFAFNSCDLLFPLEAPLDDGFTRDRKSLEGDWIVIGKDIGTAMKSLANERTK